MEFSDLSKGYKIFPSYFTKGWAVLENYKKRSDMIKLNRRYPIARKEHKCMYCGGVINVGDKYERQTNIEDWRGTNRLIV